MTFLVALAISLLDHRNAIEYPTIRRRSQQLQILRMRPHQRHRSACWLAKDQPIPVRLIPYLLRKQASRRSETLNRLNVWLHIAPRGQLIMRAFADQQWPWAPFTPPLKRTAVFPLSIPVMVVAVPAWPLRRLDFQYLIDHLQRIDDQRIIRAPDAVPHQFQKAPVHNSTSLKLVTHARPSIGNPHGLGAALFVSVRLTAF